MKDKDLNKTIGDIFGNDGLARQVNLTDYTLKLREFENVHEKLFEGEKNEEYMRQYLTKIKCNVENAEYAHLGKIHLSTTNNVCVNYCLDPLIIIFVPQ